MDQVNRSLNDLVDAPARGYKGDALRERLDALETRRSELKAVIEAAPAAAPRLHPNLAELYRRKVAQLAELRGGHRRLAHRELAAH